MSRLFMNVPQISSARARDAITIAVNAVARFDSSLIHRRTDRVGSTRGTHGARTAGASITIRRVDGAAARARTPSPSAASQQANLRRLSDGSASGDGVGIRTRDSSVSQDERIS
ncbi:MAG: hypothetical protein JSR54_04615 [Proteobacteria bacterium]|nr:hypothetical protein [Pseudomonadota bacterium]